MLLDKSETRGSGTADGWGRKSDRRNHLHSCQHGGTTETLSVIKALTASDSDAAPFCSGPVSAWNFKQSRVSCERADGAFVSPPPPSELPI